jgi:hypothetical protein
MAAWEWSVLREDFSHLGELPEEKERINAEVDKRRARSRRALARIFKKYCEAGEDAKRVRDVLHCGGEVPDYNPKTERVLSVTDDEGSVVVETQMAHNFKFRLRYELVKVNGKWRIRDNRKCMGDFSTRWSRWDL